MPKILIFVINSSKMSPAPTHAVTGSRVELSFDPLPQFRAAGVLDSAETADCHGKRIGILIVTYNAVNTLQKVLRRITPQVWRNVEAVAVLDDASQDATYELAVGIQTVRDIPKLRVIKHLDNLGYGGNQKAGYRYFLEQGFDVVVLLHGDGQYAPELLSSMYGPIVRGEADAVFGSRMMRDYGGPLKGGMPLYKLAGNKILTYFENKALGLNLTEFHSGYRAYDLHALSEIKLDNMTDDFHFDTEIIIKLHRQKYRILEVPIPTFYGDEVCYVNGLKYAKNIARAVVHYEWTIRSVRSFPEFSEYFVTTPVKASRYSSEYYIRRCVGTGQTVLSLGCRDSAFSAELSRQGNQVVTVQTGSQTPGAAEPASVIRADPDRDIELLARRLQDEKFNWIVLLDALEHLRDPAPVLQLCGRLLGTRGRLLVSVPNAANFTVRMMLLFGRFSYADRGILDWSHLRFFTKKSIRQLLEANGYRVERRHFTVVPLERLIPFSPEGRLLRFLNYLQRLVTGLLPGLLAYEVILVASIDPCAPRTVTVPSEL